MPHRFTFVITALALLAGCATVPGSLPKPASHPVQSAPAHASPVSMVAARAAPSGPPANDNLNAVAWTQTAIEHDLIYLQTYRDAQSRLLAALKDKSWDALPKTDRVRPARDLKPAVILDVDETVLDNSPYQARLIRSGGEFNEAGWAAWCRSEQARALPGAVAFTQFAAEHGIKVIYISNRAKGLNTVTIANLRKVGLPVTGPEDLLGLGTKVKGCAQIGSEKGCRRQLVSRHYRVLMQLGDQLGDFVTVLANTPQAREKAMAPYRSWIGTRWFVLPNPTYGAWEPALFHNDWSAPPEQRRKAKEAALRYN